MAVRDAGGWTTQLEASGGITLDTVRQVALEPTCACCDRQAVVNARIVDGALTTAGPRIALDVIDSEEDGPVSYRPMCLRCWKAAQQGGPTTDIG